MAWLSGLAGKAETLLNKIDQNTAAVLSTDKNSYDQMSLISSINRSPQRQNVIEADKIIESPKRLTRPVRSDLNMEVSSSPSSSKMQEHEELMTYLNTPSITPSRSVIGIGTGPPTPSSLVVEPSTENSDSISDLVIHSGRTSPEPLRITLDISDNESTDETNLNLTDENSLLRQEIEKLQNELIVTSHIEKSIESENGGFREKFDTLRREYEYRLAQQKLEMERLIERSVDGETKRSLRAAKKILSDKTESMRKQRTDHQKEIDALREKIKLYDKEASESSRKLNETQTALERCRLELNATRLDLEQHRARALKTLQEKEKLIAELRNDSRAGSDDNTMIMELNQLRQECEVLREENQQVREQLRLSREELMNVDLKIEETSRKAIEATRETHEIVSVERQRRIEAEEEAQHHLEEVRNLRDELETQLNNWSTKYRKQETEITRLRSQLSAASTPSSAVESRLSSLTQTLVSKQQALESLTTEKNALRLQLEKMELEYRKIVASSRKNCYNSVNDTDDAKAQIPTFFLESPFDTGVARRVKRAYSTLDAISVRTGVFLRRYPLARIFVIIYMALLQFWVVVVLFSQSPEAH
ncbi:golgin subfamily A member 5 [Venturia canescens]|uniref:golgin subfamily A member 5 n=1 Tax=Venturia canescens TaxID=32260 RepID=UPI001C9C71BB|nr:golgin subfamily A member 5 [Venturia canescens]